MKTKRRRVTVVKKQPKTGWIGVMQGRLPSTILGPCVECSKPCHQREEYIVRGEIWAEAGLHAWDAGYLHRQCLEVRLGRSLSENDLLVQVVHEVRYGVQLRFHPDYFTSPECLDHRGGA